jgi:hypothetical protein
MSGPNSIMSSDLENIRRRFDTIQGSFEISQVSFGQVDARLVKPIITTALRKPRNEIEAEQIPWNNPFRSRCCAGFTASKTVEEDDSRSATDSTMLSSTTNGEGHSSKKTPVS